MYRGYQVKQGITTLVNKLGQITKGKDFEVVFRGTGAATDITSTVILPRINDDAFVTNAEFNRYCGYVIHEVLGHVLQTAVIRVSNVYLHQLWNALEDGWIEGNTIASGDAPNAERLLTNLVEYHYQEAIDADIDWADPRQWPFALALWSRRYLHIRPPVPAPIADIFDEAISISASSSADNLEIARQVYNKLEWYLRDNDKPDEPRPDDSGDDSDEDESGDDSDGESGGESGGEGNESGESGGESGSDSDGDSDGESGESGGESSKKIPEGYGKGLGDIRNPTAVEPTPDGRIESVNQRNRRIERERESHKEQDVPITHKVPTSFGETAYHCRRRFSGWDKIHTPAKLRYELNRLFEGSAREQWNSGQRAGQINSGALSRHSFDDAVFRRRQEDEGIDTALSIIIDASGSTDSARDVGEPAIYQAELATVEAIYDALRGTNVAIETYCYGNETVRITNFGEGVNVFRANVKNAWSNTGLDNNDLQPLIIAHRSLLARPEKRRIVLYLTDGGIFAEKEVYNQSVVGANLGITTIGVGIYCNLAGIFPQYVNIANLKSLANTSFAQIKLAA
jgi:hypothetical protein